MGTVNLTQIEEFLKNDSYVLFGVSRNKQKFGNHILTELGKKDFKVFPIHTEMDSYANWKCYKNLSDLPEKPNAAIVCTKPEKTAIILEELKNYGITNVWLQQGAENKDIIEQANANFTNVVFGRCIFMFANPGGMHKFHSNILRFFGKYPTKN